MCRVKPPVYLTEPGCEEACDPCPRQCAVKRIQLRWWEKEEASLLAQPPPLEDAKDRWLVDLAEAQARQQQLQQDIALVSRGRSQAWLVVRQLARVPVRPH